LSIIPVAEKIVMTQPEQMVFEGLFESDAPEPGFAEDKEKITYERRKKVMVTMG